MKRRLIVLFAIAAHLGCATTDSVDSSSPTEGESRPTPLTIEVDPDPAPWLEDPVEDEPPSIDGEIVARGIDCAVAAVHPYDRHYLFQCLDDRQLGHFAAPENAVWVGLGSEDEALAADSRGVLYATSLEEISWQRRAELPAPTMWDAIPDRVVASDGTEIWISTDGGDSFDSVRLDSDSEITRIFARSDGLIVAATAGADDEREVYSSSDLGESWEHVSTTPGELVRRGAWIIDTDTGEVLARNGRDWLPHPDDDGTADWQHFFRIGDHFQVLSMADFTRWTADNPPPPQSSGELLVGRGRGFGRGGNVDIACEGLGCLRPGGFLAMTPTRYRFVGHALYSPAEDDGSSESLPRPPIEYPPATAIADTRRGGTFELASVPAVCHAEDSSRRLIELRGLALLLCSAGNERSAFVTAGEPEWTREWTVPTTVENRDEQPEFEPLQPAADGTIAVQEGCESDDDVCRVWVRPPVGPGEADGWGTFGVDGAVTYRTLDGGEAVAITATGEGPKAKLEFLRVGRNGTVETIIGDVPLPRMVTSRVDIDEQHRIVVISPGEGGDSEPLLLHTDGEWYPADGI